MAARSGQEGRPGGGGPGPGLRAVVVGAGISGLAAAWELTGTPGVAEVVVLDRADRVGGVLAPGDLAPDGPARRGSPGSAAWPDRPVRLDAGAEALLARRPEAVTLIREVGLDGALEAPATISSRVLSRGRSVPMPAGTMMGLPRRVEDLADVLTPDELARAAAEPEVPAPALTEDTDVAGWVAQRFGPAVVDRLVEPLLGGVYAGHASRLSLRATLPMVWPIAARGGSVLRALGPAAGEPPSPPAPGSVFAGIRGGVHRLPSAVAEALWARGARIELGTTVRGLRRTGSWLTLLTGPVGAAAHVAADVVVLAVPAPAAARLLAEIAPAAGSALGGVETASMGLVTAVVDGEVLAGVGGSSGILVPPVEGLAIKAATFSSVKWPWVAAALPAGTAALRVSLGRAGEPEVLQRDDGDLVTLALADLAGVLRVPPIRPLAARVDRWGGALPQYAPGHLDVVARVRSAVGAVPGLGIAGAVLDGVGVPACIGAGRAAARSAVASRGASGYGSLQSPAAAAGSVGSTATTGA